MKTMGPKMVLGRGDPAWDVAGGGGGMLPMMGGGCSHRGRGQTSRGWPKKGQDGGKGSKDPQILNFT